MTEIHFNCECCNYNTNRRGNYTTHLKSKRHKRNAERVINTPAKSINTPTKSINTPVKTKTTKYSCKYCNVNYSRIDHYNRHLLKCSQLFSVNEITKLQNGLKEEKAEKEELELKLTEEKQEKTELINSKVQLQQEKLEYIQKNKELQLEIEILKEKLHKCEHEVKDTEIKYLKKVGNTTNSHNNITQYIINKYPDAPNLKPIEKFDNYEKYATSYDNKAA
jgi:chromosome segregation ATPase